MKSRVENILKKHGIKLLKDQIRGLCFHFDTKYNLAHGGNVSDSQIIEESIALKHAIKKAKYLV